MTTENVILPFDVVQKMRKAELHLHLDGSLGVNTIIEMAKEQKVELPTTDPAELHKLVSVDMDCTSLVEYLRGFEITLRVLQKPYAITRAVYEVAEDCFSDGCRYIEIRFSPILHTNQGMSLSQAVAAACEGVALVEYRLQMKCRLIICGMRHMDSKVTESLAEIAWRFKNKGVVAFDLAGPEDGFSSKHHRSAFKIVRDQQLNCTIHSGEAAGADSIHDSLRYCGAHRIGHGVRLTEDESLMQYMIDRKVAIESCVTSNIQTKAVQTLEEHPIRRFFDVGIPLAVCTDNRTVSDVTLTGEYCLLQAQFDFTPAELVRLMDYSFDASFMDVTTKQHFRTEALRENLEILKDAGIDTAPIAEQFKWFDASYSVPPEKPYWHGIENPVFTEDLIRQVPKADLHLRLDGGVPIESMWEALKNSPDVMKQYKINTMEELITFMHPIHHTDGSVEDAKQLSRALLQSADNIKQGIRGIMEDAVRDGVIYMELTVRPMSHIDGELTMDSTVSTVLEAIEELGPEFPSLTMGVVLCVLFGRDGPIPFNKVADLAIQYKGKGVVGFGVYGNNNIPESAFKYFQDTFRHLKLHNINIIIAAGKKSPETIVHALHEGGACRIAGGYTVHQSPDVMEYLANHRVPVELNVGDKLMSSLTSDISGFQDFIRLLTDQNVPVVVSSFRKSLYSQSRCRLLSDVASAANLNPAELLMLIGNGFRSSLSGLVKENEMYSTFQDASETLWEAYGFSHLKKKPYMPCGRPEDMVAEM